MSLATAHRHTASPTGEVTVFLIGMRFNRLTAVRRWWPVFSAMPRMIRHLAEDPASGMLGHHLWFGRTTIMVSYWRSAADLQRFAGDADAPHLRPWREMARAMRESDAVGIWHETYVVPAGAHESVYAHMPAFGLGDAIGTVPIGPGLQTASQRLAAGAGA